MVYIHLFMFYSVVDDSFYKLARVRATRLWRDHPDYAAAGGLGQHVPGVMHAAAAGIIQMFSVTAATCSVRLSDNA